MDEQWEVVYICTAEYQAEIIRAILEENEIQSVIINKKDSFYHFGEIEVCVKREDVLKAMNIINNPNTNE